MFLLSPFDSMFKCECENIEELALQGHILINSESTALWSSYCLIKFCEFVQMKDKPKIVNFLPLLIGIPQI
jgi:hypothetical protein